MILWFVSYLESVSHCLNVSLYILGMATVIIQRILVIQALKCYFSRKLRISLYLSFLTFTGTTTLLKCFNDLPCGGVGVSPENYLALNKQNK